MFHGTAYTILVGNKYLYYVSRGRLYPTKVVFMFMFSGASAGCHKVWFVSVVDCSLAITGALSVAGFKE